MKMAVGETMAQCGTLWNSFLGGLGFPINRYICFRPYVLPVVVGLCLGITIQMMFAPFLEDSCDVTALKQASAKASSVLNTDTRKPVIRNGVVVGNDDFEARIIKHSPSNATANEAIVPKVVRPRYIATELGMREKLFVAVLTSAVSIDKLGVAIDKTLSKYVTKIIFFSTDKPSVVPNGLPMVAFADGNAAVLPVHVLNYINEHYAETFDFYLIVSDRTYLRGEKYRNMVDHISVRDDVHIGVPGPDKSYCGLEGGVLLSQSVMSQVLGQLGWCMNNIHPDNPSITLGRCVYHASQKLCSPKGGDQLLQFYQLQDFDYDDDVSDLKTRPEFNSSVVFFPMPDDISHYKLHRYFCYVALNETRHEIEAAKNDILDLGQHSPGGQDSLTWPLGVPPPYKPDNRYSVIQWTYFTETHLYLDNELSNVKEISGADKLDIDDIKKVAMQNLDKKFQSQFELRRIINGYRRFDPTRGMEYVLDLLLADRQHQNTDLVKRVHLVRPLGKVELVPMPYVTENMMITMILPLRPEQVPQFAAFMDGYARACLKTNEDIRLIVAFLYPSISRSRDRKAENVDLFAKPKAVISDLGVKYNVKDKLTWKAVENMLSDIAMLDILQVEFKTDALILVSTVNMEFSPELTSHYLNRVRMNTIKGKQVFFPMGFWQHNPNLIYEGKPVPASVEIGQRLGLFSTDSYEHGSFYTSDYRLARKMLSPTALKTTDIYNMFIAYRNFHVFRAVEPNLKLRWMNITCSPLIGKEKYQQCITRNLEGLASQHHLAMLIYNKIKRDTKSVADSGSQLVVNPVPHQLDMIQPPQPKLASDVIHEPQQENLETPGADPQNEGMIVVNTKQ